MQQTLLVTLQGPGKKLDLELPGDVPVHALIPPLLQIDGHPAPVDPWLMSSRTTGKTLRAEWTLVENKVVDGDILVLHKKEQPILPQPPKWQGAAARPAQHGSILITWEK